MWQTLLHAKWVNMHMPWLKMMLKSKGTWLAMAVMFLCYFGTSIDLWNSSINEPIIIYRPSAFVYALEPVLFGGVILVFPFCSCLPIAMSREMHSLPRICSKRKIVLAFSAGGTAVALPFVLHTIIWNLLALPVNPAVYESHQLQLYGLLNDLYGICYGMPVYAVFTLGMIIGGGTFSVIYLVASTMMKDHIVAFVTPSLIYFGWLKLSTYFSNLQIPAPVDLFNEGLTIGGGLLLLLIYTIILVLCIGLFDWMQRKVAVE